MEVKIELKRVVRKLFQQSGYEKLETSLGSSSSDGEKDDRTMWEEYIVKEKMWVDKGKGVQNDYMISALGNEVADGTTDRTRKYKSRRSRWVWECRKGKKMSSVEHVEFECLCNIQLEIFSRQLDT